MQATEVACGAVDFQTSDASGIRPGFAVAHLEDIIGKAVREQGTVMTALTGYVILHQCLQLAGGRVVSYGDADSTMRSECVL